MKITNQMTVTWWWPLSLASRHATIDGVKYLCGLAARYDQSTHPLHRPNPETVRVCKRCLAAIGTQAYYSSYFPTTHPGRD